MTKPKIYDVTATGSATPRDIRDRFADVVNVKDFGAKGNGEADDTAAFEAAAARGDVFTPAGDRYGIRYSEALALECAYQRWLGEKREQHIAALEAKLGEISDNITIADAEF